MSLWGDPNVVRERLGDRVMDLSFEREVMYVPALSPQHVRQSFEATAAPVVKLVQMLKEDAAKLARFRSDLEALIASYTRGNRVRQQYLMSCATKRP